MSIGSLSPEKNSKETPQANESLGFDYDTGRLPQWSSCLKGVPNRELPEISGLSGTKGDAWSAAAGTGWLGLNEFLHRQMMVDQILRTPRQVA